MSARFSTAAVPVDGIPASFTSGMVGIVDDAMGGIVAYCHREYAPAIVAAMSAAHNRLETIRAAIVTADISYGELAELQGLAEFITPGDDLLLQWAGVPEFDDEEDGE